MDTTGFAAAISSSSSMNVGTLQLLYCAFVPSDGQSNQRKNAEEFCER